MSDGTDKTVTEQSLRDFMRWCREDAALGLKPTPPVPLSPSEYKQLADEWTACPVCEHEEHPRTRLNPTGVCREWRSHTQGYLRECGCKGEA